MLAERNRNEGAAQHFVLIFYLFSSLSLSRSLSLCLFFWTKSTQNIDMTLNKNAVFSSSLLNFLSFFVDLFYFTVQCFSAI